VIPWYTTGNMTIYGKDGKPESTSMTATHVTVTGLATKFENVGHTVYKNTLFTPTNFLDQYKLL
jgi:hypothetical protein